jgi:hypothetical protein
MNPAKALRPMIAELPVEPPTIWIWFGNRISRLLGAASWGKCSLK